MSRNNEYGLRQLRIAPRENRVHILQRHRSPGSSLRSRFEFIHHHLQFSSGIFRDLIQSRLDRIPPAPDPPLRIRPRRKRQPRPAPHQLPLPDQHPHRFFIYRRARQSSRGSRQYSRLRFSSCRFRGIMRRQTLRRRWDGASQENKKRNERPGLHALPKPAIHHDGPCLAKRSWIRTRHFISSGPPTSRFADSPAYANVFRL